MERLTTDNPQTNTETMLNLAYAKNCWVEIRGMEQPFLAYLRTRCMEHGCECVVDESDHDTVMRMFECIADEPICPVSLLHEVATQAAELRARLKKYEDTGLEPEQIEGILERGTPLEGGTAELMKQYLALGSVDHLRELLAAERDGRLVVLPAKDDVDAKIAALNKIEAVDWSCTGGEVEYVLADATYENIKILFDAGFTVEQLNAVTGDRDIELVPLAFEVCGAEYWDKDNGFALETEEALEGIEHEK